MQLSERVAAFGVSFGRRVPPSPHAFTCVHTLCICTHKSNRPLLQFCSLMNADAQGSERSRSTHAHFKRSSLLKSLTRNAVCQKHVPLSQNISTRHTASRPPQLFRFASKSKPFWLLFDISRLQMCFLFSFIRNFRDLSSPVTANLIVFQEETRCFL